MITATANLLALPAKYLAQLVASSATFRAQVEALDEAAALGSVFIGLAETDPDTVPNRAIVRHLDAGDFEEHANTVSGGLGSLVLTFEFPTVAIGEAVGMETVEDLRDQYVHFCNLVGAIVEEMSVNANNANTDNGYLDVSGWQQGALGWASDDENNALEFMVSEWIVGHPVRVQG